MSYEKQNFIDGQPLTAGQLELMEEGIIEALQQATNISVTKADKVITVVTTLENGEKSTSEITLDDNEYPVSIVTDGEKCTLTWEGFE